VSRELEDKVLRLVLIDLSILLVLLSRTKHYVLCVDVDLMGEVHNQRSLGLYLE
jgi:hypothetical protein